MSCFTIRLSCLQAVASTIGVIKLSGKRLMQLINDLLDAAQLRKGQLVLKSVLTMLLLMLVAPVSC